MSSTSPEVPVETGSHSDFKAWEINSMAEPIMRIWQLSEALSRMAKRIQRRYPEEAKILRASSEDIIHYFFADMREKQHEFIKNEKTSETNSIKEQEEKRAKALLQKQTEEKKEGATPSQTPRSASDGKNSQIAAIAKEERRIQPSNKKISAVARVHRHE